jgi:hypothetical protein
MHDVEQQRTDRQRRDDRGVLPLGVARDSRRANQQQRRDEDRKLWCGTQRVPLSRSAAAV